MTTSKPLALMAAVLLSASVSGCVFARTDDATDLTRSDATLNGHGGAGKGPAESWFVWDTDAALVPPNHTTARRPFPVGSVVPFSARISNLSPNTTYFFRACLRDREGQRCAQIHDFRTLPTDNSVSVVAAGDIGDRDATPHMQDETAQLIRFFNPHKVLTLGDNAYPEGSLAQYLAHFDPWWGSPLGPYGAPSGFGDRLRPVPGNHESATPGQAGYYSYFNGMGASSAWGVAGQRGKGWYSFTLGNWKLIALNSANGGAPSSEQLDWLGREVASNAKRCLLAYWHHPRFSSGATDHDDLPAMQGFWNRLWSAADPSKRADLILNGHNHSYERLARQGLVGNADPQGIVEVIAGTGGTRLVPFGAIDPESRSRHLLHGVVWLALKDGSAHIRFIDTSGNLRDSATEPCH